MDDGSYKEQMFINCVKLQIFRSFEALYLQIC